MHLKTNHNIDSQNCTQMFVYKPANFRPTILIQKRLCVYLSHYSNFNSIILNYERNFILTLQVEILFPGIARIRGLRPYPSANKPLKAGIHCMPFQLLVELTLNKRSIMVAPVERKYVYFGV